MPTTPLGLVRRAFRTSTKATAAPRFGPGTGRTSWFLPRTQRNYARDVGDGLGSSLVVAVVGWIARTFPEAELTIERLMDGDWEVERDHPMLSLIELPNPFYSGTLLWAATLIDWTIDGNAYWVKVRNRAQEVVQLWYVPSWMIEPIPDDRDFIKGYKYTPAGSQVADIVYAPSEVIHFRNGLDPRNPRKGLSPLRSLVREIFTDDEAANFGAALLANMGIPGVIIAPKPQAAGSVTSIEIDSQAIKDEFNQRFTGDRRGDVMVLGAPTDVHVMSWSPDQLNLEMLRRLPEERVTAVIGVSAMVVGLGAGLAHSTYSNYEEARKAGYESNLIPTQRLMGGELRQQLLPDFEEDVKVVRAKFDVSGVAALQEDRESLARSENLLVSGGIKTVAEARQALGEPTDDTHDVYLRRPNIRVVPVDKGGDAYEPPAAGAGGGGGDGKPPEAPAEDSDNVIPGVRSAPEPERKEADAERAVPFHLTSAVEKLAKRLTTRG